MDYKEAANKIYNDSLDMDYADYMDTKENDITAIACALQKIEEYSKQDNDFIALFNALDIIYG